MNRPAEVDAPHTRLLRLGLALEPSEAYWGHVEPGTPVTANQAFESRWFGVKSMPRVKLLLTNMAVRFDAYPDALVVLHDWSPMDRATRALICHWHLQLADPVYRRFTGQYLHDRRAVVSAIEHTRVVAWVRDQGAGRWAPSTTTRFASALLSAAKDAGLLEGIKDPRPFALPRVSEEALTYILQLLRGIAFAGSLVDNPYLRSVGLHGDYLDRRLGGLDGVTYRRLGNVTDFEWRAPDLRTWAAQELAS